MARSLKTFDTEYEDKLLAFYFKRHCYIWKEGIEEKGKIFVYPIIVITATFITDSHHHARIENDHYNLTTRSEKEALKKRKKRTPTVAMTAEQYKAKRGIFLSTPKKTGRHLTEASISVFVFASFLPLSLCVGFIFLKEREAFGFTPQRKHRSIQHCSYFNLCVSVLCS